MVLLLLTLAITLAVLVAIEYHQAPRPREITAWSDDVERRLLARRSGSGRW